MKYFLPVLLLAIFSHTTQAQNNCATYSIQYNVDSVKFTAANFFDHGDSMIVFSMTNIHPTQGFAYPMSKLVNVTPLPPGMSINPFGWYVFGSSWPPDFTYPTLCYFYVDEPIPANYMVTFEVWAKNLEPLLSNTDSCVFDETFTINLNPVVIDAIENLNAANFSVYPQPAHDLMTLEHSVVNMGDLVIDIKDIAGRTVDRIQVNENESIRQVDVSGLQNGCYIMQITSSRTGDQTVLKFVKS